MSEEALRLITGIALILAPFLSGASLVLVAYLNAKLNRVEKNVDGKLEDLLKAREDAAGARGQLHERDAQREHLASIQPIITPIISTDEDPLKVELVKSKHDE